MAAKMAKAPRAKSTISMIVLRIAADLADIVFRSTAGKAGWQGLMIGASRSFFISTAVPGELEQIVRSVSDKELLGQQPINA